MMRVIIGFAAVLVVAQCHPLQHIDTDGHKASSYQHIHIEHYHSVPTFIKKEHAHLLEHPIPKGETKSDLEVLHGGKHDHGFAIGDSQTHLHHVPHEEIEEHEQHEHQEHQERYEHQGHHPAEHEGHEEQQVQQYAIAEDAQEHGEHQNQVLYAHYAVEGHGEAAEEPAQQEQHYGLGHYQ